MGVRLVATKVLNYAGQRYTPGEPFISRTKEHARLLKALGRAVDEPPVPVVSPKLVDTDTVKQGFAVPDVELSSDDTD